MQFHASQVGIKSLHGLQKAVLAIALLVLGGQAIAQVVGKPIADDAQRGAYLVAAGGCLGCHTAEKKDAVPFAGGRALKTPFGTFYGPNITPDRKAGIGAWTEAQFIRAMRYGERPDGSNYFPAFPYPSFTKISDADLHDLWAYLRTLPPSSQPSRQHDLRLPFDFRFAVSAWKWLFFSPGPFTPIAQASAPVNRGAYLVQALGHCGECHTPRNFMGGPKSGRALAGGKGPEGKDVANLTPTGLKKWNDGDLKEFLLSGLSPDGDVTAKAMGEVVTNTTSKLTPPDLGALIAYLRSLAPLPNEPGTGK
ncbi:MAG TPA: cytochrome c [Ramlibacter sp.]|nr:cytochrome c [Ramlibacter sp.]